jgi:hypothetical protein
MGACTALVAGLVVLAGLGWRFGADSRDGRDWRYEKPQ